uniref:Uncharacterized protein n=1 Tax=Arundo donax TaxID=35708 RepID=A0A0A9CGN2_ARUDO
MFSSHGVLLNRRISCSSSSTWL